MSSANQSKTVYAVFVAMDAPLRSQELLTANTLREASEAVRAWLMGGNEHGEYIGASQMGRDCGRVTDAKTGVEVARVSYNGRVWEPGKYPTPEITNLD